jgi:hypothetical protein
MTDCATTAKSSGLAAYGPTRTTRVNRVTNVQKRTPDLLIAILNRPVTYPIARSNPRRRLCPNAHSHRIGQCGLHLRSVCN